MKETNENRKNRNKELALMLQKDPNNKSIKEELYLLNRGLIDLCYNRSFKFYGEIEYEDFLQEGYIGLINGAMHFSEEKGSFSTVAYNYIYSQMSKHVGNTSLNIRLPLSKFTKCKSYIRIFRHYYEDLPYSLSDALNKTAEETDDTVEHVKENIYLYLNIRYIVSLDSEIITKNGQNNLLFYEIIENKQVEDINESIILDELREKLTNIVNNQLSEPEKKVIEYLFGINNKPILTQTEISKKLNCSKQNISQLLKKALTRMKIQNASLKEFL